MVLWPTIWEATSIPTPRETITVSNERLRLWNERPGTFSTPARSQSASNQGPRWPRPMARCGACTVRKTSGASLSGRASST